MMNTKRVLLSYFITILILLHVMQLVHADETDLYDVGVGIGDITGPCAEIEFGGYATFNQPGAGIHFRLYSRTVIISKKKSRVVLVTTDLWAPSEILKIKVVEKLQEKYGQIYRSDNIVISATHSHSTPSGFHQYVLYTLPSYGVIKQVFDAALQGIVYSIDEAHRNLKPGHLFINSGILLDVNVNRSPSAYANNPEEERKQYEYDVDKTMTVLKITDISYKAIGAISWFAVHPTSMNNTNRLISGDNKGYASMMLEKAYNGNKSLPGTGPFVASFPNAAHGDTSPNTLGSKCINTGLPCDFNTSSCNGMSDDCIASGPGKDMFESTKIIGYRQYEKALELLNTASQEIKGSVLVIHQHMDITTYKKDFMKGNEISTCQPAYGYSFAAGTTDGPGLGIMTQGRTEETTFWNLFRGFIQNPSDKMKKCQSPKPILLSTGEISFPHSWNPKILPTQLLKIGQLFLAPLPGELTTMAGRRMAQAIKNVYREYAKEANIHVVIQSMSNEYSSYVTTSEEYQIQRYEGASTVYGQHTLEAYIDQYEYLTQRLLKRENISPGPKPPDFWTKATEIYPGVFYDETSIGVRFGDLITDVEKIYKIGDTVTVSFASGHPRNDLRLQSTYLTVERLNEINESWEIIATDGNWETKFHWKRMNWLLGSSKVVIEWIIPNDSVSGTYKIRHFGAWKNLNQEITPYSGTSSDFRVEKI